MNALLTRIGKGEQFFLSKHIINTGVFITLLIMPFSYFCALHLYPSHTVGSWKSGKWYIDIKFEGIHKVWVKINLMVLWLSFVFVVFCLVFVSEMIVDHQIETGLLKPDLKDKVTYTLLRRHRHQTKKSNLRSLADIGKTVSSASRMFTNPDNGNAGADWLLLSYRSHSPFLHLLSSSSFF